MDRKKLLLMTAALMVAIVTALAARSLFSGSTMAQAEAAPQLAQGPKVLVAGRELPVGTILTADAVSFQPWPKEMLRDAYLLDSGSDMAKLLGTVVRLPVPAGQPVTRGALVQPGDRGFLAAALGPGMRAVTIAVSARTGVGGFVFPGDHVDLMLTQTIGGGGPESRSLSATETFLANLRVLATDQSTETESAGGKTVARAVNTVTLEVTSRMAEKIEVAGSMGTLSLALRSIADNAEDLDRAVASGAVKLPENASREEEARLLARAMAMPVERGGSFVTGADVSRFQRRGMPPTSIPVAPVYVAPPPAGGAGFSARSRGPIVNVTRGKQSVAVAVDGS
ncbi:MAG: Flp pilus assembly protein CpaB [Novosphingobium sp.]